MEQKEFNPCAHVSYWMVNDLDCVAEKGDQLYKTQRTTFCLSYSYQDVYKLVV